MVYPALRAVAPGGSKKFVAFFLLMNLLFFSSTFTVNKLAEGRYEKDIVVIIPSYKNEEWCERNLDSVFKQNYENYQVIYIDDCSPDNTFERVKKIIEQRGQMHRVKLVRNEVNQGALANLYRTIHACDDNKIIVTLDGDDWFAHENVLALVNQVYSDFDIWMSYGSYRNYPDGRLGCNREIPKEVVAENSFRDYMWVTSHLRTFYAWFFKQVKLEDLLYEGKFFPMTWDLAFMFPMLEMSGGKFKYISEIVYEYNFVNPLNDCKKNEEFQLYLDRLIRNKARYEPLVEGKNNWSNSFNNAQADMVVFSCDRPMQLYAFLESIETYVKGLSKINVIYRTTEDKYNTAYREVALRFSDVEFVKQGIDYRKDFKPLTLRSVFNSQSDYVLFADDDVILTDFVDVNRCIRALEQTHAYAFFLRLGKNLSKCYMLNVEQKVPPCFYVEGDIHAWQFVYGEYDWRYPHTIDLTLYRKADIRSDLEAMQYSSPNTFEGSWSTRKFDLNKVGLFFDHSKLVNIPLNRVQMDALNSHMNISQDFLLDKFNEGFKIDISRLYKFDNISAQMEVELDFVRR